jgi:hypothetical protein
MQIATSLSHRPPNRAGHLPEPAIVGTQHFWLTESPANSVAYDWYPSCNSFLSRDREMLKMILKIDRGSERGRTILRLSGRIQSEQLEQLKVQMEGIPEAVLDLKDVRLVDRDVVRFLGVCELNGTELRHCSAYIREWILKERADP